MTASTQRFRKARARQTVNPMASSRVAHFQTIYGEHAMAKSIYHRCAETRNQEESQLVYTKTIY